MSTSLPGTRTTWGAARQLATCRWVEEYQTIAITGMTGTGKTYVACALAQQACRKGYRVLYRRATRLNDELALARADGSYAVLLARFARADVLVLDDWGLAPPKDLDAATSSRRGGRCGSRATIITSQLPTAKWHEHVGDPTVADAFCDRLLNNAHRIVPKGPSRRKEASGTDK